jgi:hypothetical protein
MLNDKDFSEDFAQKMRNRMATSQHKYGSVASNRTTIDFVANIKARLAKYEADGNTEWLVDAANFAMMEYEIPLHPSAHFRPTTSAEAPRLDKL